MVDDDNDIDWWIDDEDLEDYSDHFEEYPEALIETREISGLEWNNKVVGSIYDDHQGFYLDEDCPECGHFLVHPNSIGDLYREEVPLTMKHCSNLECKYATFDFIEASLKADQPKVVKEWTKLRLVNETIEEFCHRNKLSLFERNGDFVMKECIVCKQQKLEPDDWYQTKEYAVVTFNHEGCDNGPCTMVPLGDKKKEWSKLFTGFFPDKN